MAPSTVDPGLASLFARVVLAGVRREFPHKLDQVLNGPEDVRSPKELHPAFFGCFDWHSAVHGHWLLARVLRLAPGVAEAEEIRGVLDEHLTHERIAVEAAYLSRPNSGSFERTYGWAWLLKLAEELSLASDVRVRLRADALRPLAGAFVQRYLNYLPRAEYPLRVGTHTNTAFGLSFALDYASRFDERGLGAMAVAKAREFFATDADREGWGEMAAEGEPSGSDFFSPVLLEADLMRRVMTGEEYAAWLGRFWPGLAMGRPRSVFAPARVSDRADLQIVHLDGLNFSRAWCMRSIASGLPDGHAARGVLERSAGAHMAASLAHVASGHFGGEHWLATFAMLGLTGA